MSGHGLAVAIFFLSFAVSIIAPFWVYMDAMRNSNNSAFLWALVVLFGNIFGLLLYLIVGRK